MFSYNQLWSFKALVVVFGELVIQRRPRQSHLKALVNLGSCHSCRKSMYAYTEHLEVSRFCCAAETQGIPGGHAEAVTPRTCMVCYKHGSWFQTSSNFQYFEISVPPLKTRFRQIWAPRLWTICSSAGEAMEEQEEGLWSARHGG